VVQPVPCPELRHLGEHGNIEPCKSDLIIAIQGPVKAVWQDCCCVKACVAGACVLFLLGPCLYRAAN
jgi:hypothetical protein